MLKFFKQLSLNRGGWFLLFLSTLALESTALYFQYGMGLAPCVMCIYERVALFGLTFSALLGLSYPRSLVLRLSALAVGLGSSIKGLLLAIKHVDYQLNPGPWNQCSYLAEFPQTLPLDRWLPYIFNPTGSCSEITWMFLGFSMAQWIVVVFAFYSLLLLLLLVSQFKHIEQSRNIFR